MIERSIKPYSQQTELIEESGTKVDSTVVHAG
jgi:hypothetical protein